jgi:hypothetical protein
MTAWFWTWRTGRRQSINALPALIEALRTGYAELCSEEPDGKENLLAVQFAPAGDTVLHLWLDGNYTPVRADFVSAGLAGIKLRSQIGT